MATLRRLVVRVVRRFVEERFDQLSASLAYTTLLSLVPLLAVVLGVVSVMPEFLGVVEQLDQFFLANLLPERSARIIVGYLLEFSQKAANVTVVGLLVLVTIDYFLLVTIERAFNHVWHVTAPRVWWRRLLMYAAVLTLWPLSVAGVIAALSYAVTLSLGLVSEIPWLGGVLYNPTGLPVAALFFATLYYVVPNAKVVMRDAWSAGCFAAAGFWLMQQAFELYLANFPAYTVVYGAFATVPIFLFWLYLSWAVILLGALLAATLPEFRGEQA